MSSFKNNWGVISKSWSRVSCLSKANSKRAKIGLFENFQNINAPHGPTQHFKHHIYTYIYINIYNIYIIYYIYIYYYLNKKPRKSHEGFGSQGATFVFFVLSITPQKIRSSKWKLLLRTKVVQMFSYVIYI